MKVLLVVPASEKYRVRSHAGEIPRRNMLRFSVLPVTSVAAATPPQHQVSICDENVEALDFEQDVDLVGISILTATSSRGREIAQAFRGRGKCVVAGGYHATLFTEDIIDDFDAVVLGDAEGVWPDLLNDFESGCLKKVYNSPIPFDLADIKTPRRDLTERVAHYYATTNAVQIGRGCRHGCKFCSITAFHHKSYRQRPVSKVIAELRQLPRDIMFVDDNIIADPDYAKELFKEMVPLGKRWGTQCSLQIADDQDLLYCAYEAGCRALFIGIETIDQTNLESMCKEFNKQEQYRRRISAIHDAGIGIIAGIIVGIDNDDIHVFERTLDFLLEFGIEAVQLNIMTPLPGTALYDDFKKSGRIVDHDFDHYDFRHAVFNPKHMSRAQLQEGADWLYSEFYRLDRIMLRSFRTLFRAGPQTAYLTWKLNMTYRYDNLRESIRGANPARHPGEATGEPQAVAS